MLRLPNLLPRSLVGRVFALYTVTLLAFVGVGLAMFYRLQFLGELEALQERADTLASVILPAISDSAVIGDDDTIQRTLERAIYRSYFASAEFIDMKGRKVHVSQPVRVDGRPPDWIVRLVAGQIYDSNRPISVGGRDYGVVRLHFAPELVADDLWKPARAALLLALSSLVGGLLLIRLPLVHWLGHLERLRDFEQDLEGTGSRPGGAGFADSAPIEMQLTFDVLSRAAANLQSQRAQAAVTLAAITDAVLTLDPQGVVILANPAAGQLFGRPVDELLRQPAARLLPALLDERSAPLAWRARRTELTGPMGRRVVDTTLSPILGAGGAVVAHVLACRDVTEQHELDQRLRAELALRESTLNSLRDVLEGLSLTGHAAARDGNDIATVSLLVSELVAKLQDHSAQLDAIFALSPDAFVSFDARRQVSYTSPAFMQLTGLTQEAVVGLDEAAFMARVAAQCDDAARTTLASLTPDPETRAVATRRALIQVAWPTQRVLEVALRGSASNVISQVFHMRDVTHATEVDRMKSEFLSTAAHELRTPMASIFGFCELLMLREMSAEKRREVLEIIHRQSALMITIINELLDLARIEARRGQDFVLETLDLAGLLDEAVTRFNAPGGRPAPRRHASPSGALVHVDRNKLLQAVGNVLSNAYKYSPEGESIDIVLFAGDAAVPPRPGCWGIRVEDRGIGMTDEQVARIGERFFRADASGEIPGTGLGMSIVKEIVELLGGSLDVDSRHGEGTRVTLWLRASAR